MRYRFGSASDRTIPDRAPGLVNTGPLSFELIGEVDHVLVPLVAPPEPVWPARIFVVYAPSRPVEGVTPQGYLEDQSPGRFLGAVPVPPGAEQVVIPMPEVPLGWAGHVQTIIEDPD